MRTIITVFLLSATLALAQTESAKIIPVSAWPRVLNLADKQVINPSVSECVTAGYRLLAAKPATPTGKRIAIETIIQDTNDVTKCTYQITYEDIPAPIAPTPEVLTNVPASKVTFNFTTGGSYRGVTWIDAPKTNGTK
jgi:hypothetical protein